MLRASMAEVGVAGLPPKRYLVYAVVASALSILLFVSGLTIAVVRVVFSIVVYSVPVHNKTLRKIASEHTRTDLAQCLHYLVIVCSNAAIGDWEHSGDGI
jgi:Na+/H+ antiporter NhaA